MFAIPLVARGRGVAVLYADYGAEGEGVNVEALETLVRFAGLTVEVLASSLNAKTSQVANQTTEYAEESLSTESGELSRHSFETAREFQSDAGVQSAESETAKDYQASEIEQTDESVVEESAEELAENDYQPTSEYDGFSTQRDFQPEVAESDFTSDDASSVEEVEEEIAPETDYSFEKSEVEEVETEQPIEEVQDEEVETEQPVEETYSWNQPAEPEVQDDFEEHQPAVSENGYSAPSINDYQVEQGESVDSTTAQFEETPQFETTENFSFEKAEKFVPYENTNGKADVVYEPVEMVSETVTSAPVKTRFSDRNVDLPIEVGEEERRLHNDARRFARLLVSEIKLYNEQKVKEGRESADLYERLREAIDRSREMYDKRVQPPVAAKFDYFHYELVSTLAEGEETKLGGSYPGAAI